MGWSAEQMTLLERLQKKRQARLDMRESINLKNARGFEKNIELQKGDFLALLISGFFCFVLPIMLVIGAICGIAYLLFVRF